MMLRRNDDQLPGAILGRSIAWVQRFRRHQNAFSVASSLVATVLVVTFIIVLLGNPREAARSWAFFWLASYTVFAIAPIVCGHRFSKWAGLIMVLYFAVWSAVFIETTDFGHTEINAFLQVPVIALYLGWFYQQWFARSAALIYLVMIGIAVFMRPVPFVEDDLTYMGLTYAVLIALFCLEAGSYVQRTAESRALRDPLTGVWNRRGLVEKGEPVLRAANSAGKPLTLVVADFDDFKLVNDTGGHAAGDNALRVTSQSWVTGFTPSALVARSGGDEFVLMVGADKDTTHARLAEIRAQAMHSWSWGLAQAREGDTLDSLMQRADNRMYRMKGNGS